MSRRPLIPRPTGTDRRTRRHQLIAAHRDVVRRRTLRQVMIVMALLIVGGLGFWALIVLTRTPQRVERPLRGPLVSVAIAEPRNVQMIVRGYGTVRAKATVQIVPQVSGKVTELHPQLVNGGFFRAGETLVVIEPDDYELDVTRAEADLRQAKAARVTATAQIDDTQARLDDAQRERDRVAGLLEAGVAKPRELEKSQLALDVAKALLRVAQSRRETAIATQAANEAALARARLDLQRTRIAAPFDGRISEESIDVGQHVVAGQSIATVYSTGVMEVSLPLETRELAWFDLPHGNREAAIAAIKVDLTAEYAGKRHTWAGTIVRSEGRIDPDSRMVHVVVEVNDPDRREGRPDLMPGMFVEALIYGRMLEGTIPVVRESIRRGDHIWTVTGGVLQKDVPIGETASTEDTEPRETFETDDWNEALTRLATGSWTLIDARMNVVLVEILRRDSTFAYIAAGLEPDELYVISPMDTPAHGMLVRARLGETSADATRPADTTRIAAPTTDRDASATP